MKMPLGHPVGASFVWGCQRHGGAVWVGPESPDDPPPRVTAMDSGTGARKERPKPREPAARLEKAKQRSAQQELKQRQRAEVGTRKWGGTQPRLQPNPLCNPPFPNPRSMP